MFIAKLKVIEKTPQRAKKVKQKKAAGVIEFDMWVKMLQQGHVIESGFIAHLEGKKVGIKVATFENGEFKPVVTAPKGEAHKGAYILDLRAQQHDTTVSGVFEVVEDAGFAAYYDSVDIAIEAAKKLKRQGYYLKAGVLKHVETGRDVAYWAEDMFHWN